MDVHAYVDFRRGKKVPDMINIPEKLYLSA